MSMRKRHRESSDDEEEDMELSLGSSRHRLMDNHMQTIDVDGPPSLFSRTSNIGSSTPSKMVGLTIVDVTSVASYLRVYGVNPIKVVEKECIFPNGSTSRDKTRICFRILKRSGFLALKSGKYVINDASAIPSAEDVAAFAQAEDKERKKAERLLVPSTATSSSSSSSSSSSESVVAVAHPPALLESVVPPNVSQVQLELARKLLYATSNAHQQHHGDKLVNWVNYQLQCSALDDVHAIIDNFEQISQHVLPDTPSEIDVAEEAVERGEVSAFTESSIKDLQPALEEARSIREKLKEQLESVEIRLSYLKFLMKEKARELVKGWCEGYVKQMHEREEACRLVMVEIEEDDK